ncbi:MAG: GatB/YqeY domain-containing protein [Verrucomicrobia bacterium]|nr:GatB/YqeY domain-containing protein [Verrucomicrobiota bacterium]
MTPTLFDKIQADLKQAMLSKDALRTSVLRLLVSAARYYQEEKSLKALADEDILQVLKRQVKQRRDSIESFAAANRSDMAEKERQELAILEGYLPQQMSEAEITALVKAAIAETGAASKAQAGLVMKAVMPKLQGRADGKLVNQTVMKLLGA